MAAGIQNVPTKYWAAAIVLAFLDLFGWLLLISGVALMVFSLSQMSVQNYYGGTSFNFAAGMFTFGPAVGLIFGGLVALANVQLTRAAIDTADISRETLLLMRQQL